MSEYLCDKCRNGVWHANGDGRFCCTAPGMGSVTAKSRKKALDWAEPKTICKHYEEGRQGGRPGSK